VKTQVYTVICEGCNQTYTQLFWHTGEYSGGSMQDPCDPKTCKCKDTAFQRPAVEHGAMVPKGRHSG
jgi:hypothetical protein